MFGYLEKIQKNFQNDLSKLIYYFERHIELDSDTHGPYGNADDKRTLWIRCAKWAEVEEIAKMKDKHQLWDAMGLRQK
jgi:hypothetical protein